jgi:hypothetical protein
VNLSLERPPSVYTDSLHHFSVVEYQENDTQGVVNETLLWESSRRYDI